MHPTVRTVVVVVVVALAFVGGLAVGDWLIPHPSNSKNSPSTPSRSTTLSIVGAGTLGTLFPQVATALVNGTPGISAPTTAQTYEGSLLAMAAVRTSGANPDIAAAADYRLIPSGLEPTYASWEVMFGSTPEVLAYDPSAPAMANITTANWATAIQQSGVVLGVANASTDPNGYNGIFVLQLEGELLSSDLGSVYGHFYTTPVGGYAAPNPSTAKIEPETQAKTLLSTHAVQAFIIYRSYAVANHIPYVDLDPRVGLGNLSASDIAFDSQASTSIVNSTGGLTKITGAPVVFAATVPLNAANATLGTAFLNLLLSSEGQALLMADGFSPIAPAWSDHPSQVPVELRPGVVAVPAGLPSP